MLNKLSHAAALDTLGELNPASLPGLAVELLVAGIESHSLVLLAGETASAHPGDLRDLFYASLRELGVAVPSEADAAIAVRNLIATEVVAGRTYPRDGADQLADLDLKTEEAFEMGPHVGSGLGVEEVVGIFYSYDYLDLCSEQTRATESARLDADVVTACRRILGSAEPAA